MQTRRGFLGWLAALVGGTGAAVLAPGEAPSAPPSRPSSPSVGRPDAAPPPARLPGGALIQRDFTVERAGEVVTVSAVADGSFWVRGYMLYRLSDFMPVSGVVRHTLAGIPANVAEGSAPAAGRRFLRFGQTAIGEFSNLPRGEYRWVLFGEVIGPFVQQQIMQMKLLNAAASGFSAVEAVRCRYCGGAGSPGESCRGCGAPI